MLLVEFLEIDILVSVSRDSSNGCISRFPFKPRYGGDKSLWGFIRFQALYTRKVTFAVGLPRLEQPPAEARNEIRARLSRKRSGSIYVYTNSTKDHSSSCGRGMLLQYGGHCTVWVYVGEGTEYDQLAIASDTLQDLCILSLISLPTLFYPSHRPVHSTTPMYTMRSEYLGEIAMDT